MSSPITFKRCKNCNEYLTSDHNYCSTCGAKIITERITLKKVLNESIERFFNIDNSFFRTFRDLWIAPENVIDGYINGLRKRYLNAFSYFALSLTIAGFYIFVLRKFSITPLSSEGDPNATFNNSVFNFSSDYQALLSSLSIPILALISMVVFHNYKKYNFTEHIIIYLYSYSHIAAVLSLIGAFGIFAGSFNSLLITLYAQILLYIIYHSYVLKRLFKLSTKQIILKTLLFLVILLFLFIIASIGAAILMFITDTLPPTPTK